MSISTLSKREKVELLISVTNQVKDKEEHLKWWTSQLQQKLATYDEDIMKVRQKIFNAELFNVTPEDQLIVDVWQIELESISREIQSCQDIVKQYQNLIALKTKEQHELIIDILAE